jgi:PPM family protein phosphatase
LITWHARIIAPFESVQAMRLCPCAGGGQDRAVLLHAADRLVVALADGAGGTGRGAIAAQMIIDAATTRAAACTAWDELLVELDVQLQRLGGQSTAIVLTILSSGLVGASVGDSSAWIVRGDAVEDLTGAQQRKPLLGAGCTPRRFQAAPLEDGTLLVASDGLFSYAKPADITCALRDHDLDRAADALIDLVRLPPGQVPDDVAIVLLRMRPA